MSRRSRIVGFGSAGVLVVAGIACAFAFSGSLGQNLAFVLVALGLVLATSLVFYEVGLTEDRDRGARVRRGASARRATQDRASHGRSAADPPRPDARPAETSQVVFVNRDSH